ncbi:MAG: hypothetical protein ACOY3P_24970 [Planctomycetota bacterium]
MPGRFLRPRNPRTLHALRDDDTIESFSHGLYRLDKAPPLTNPDWVAVAARVPQVATERG